MVSLVARPTVEKDIPYIAKRLRDEDLREVQAHSGVTGREALSIGYAASDVCFTVSYETMPIAMFGCGSVPGQPDLGIIWMLGTPKIQDAWVPFARDAKEWVEYFSSIYPTLWNVVDKRNTLHIRWLKWLGFDFIDEHKTYGVEQIPFLEFNYKRED